MPEMKRALEVNSGFSDVIKECIAVNSVTNWKLNLTKC